MVLLCILAWPRVSCSFMWSLPSFWGYACWVFLGILGRCSVSDSGVASLHCFGYFCGFTGNSRAFNTCFGYPCVGWVGRVHFGVGFGFCIRVSAFRVRPSNTLSLSFSCIPRPSRTYALHRVFGGAARSSGRTSTEGLEDGCVGSLCVGSVGVVMGGEDLAASWSLHSVSWFSGFCLRCALGSGYSRE